MAKPRIFIGSSTEAVDLARKLATALEMDGLTTVVWDTNAFPVGSTLLERIEAFADEFEGAILLFTPDVRSVRGAREFEEPVSNVMFEYGYLSARLTRPRVAVCLFEGAHLPSDLQGVKVINAGTIGYQTLEGWEGRYNDQKLPTELVRELKTWAESLPRLAERIPPTVQLHGYSGTWRIDTRFEMWRGVRVDSPNEVFWYGFTSLFIPTSGRGGKGIMHGTADVNWGDYHCRHDVLNEVRDATVNRHGMLTLRVIIVRRHLTYEEGPLPDERFRGDLPPKDFEIRLNPVAGHCRELRGVHRYTRGAEVYQAAVEQYIRID